MVHLRAFAIALGMGAIAAAAFGDRGEGAFSSAIAAPIATPAAGSAVPLSAPTPIDPVQYVVSPNTTGSSSAYNSNNFKIYTDLLSVINALNGCSYIPGAAIGTITTLSPLNVSISSCSSGTGTGATATLSLGGIVPQANLPTSPVFTGSIGALGSYVAPVYISLSGAISGPTEHVVRFTATTGTGGTYTATFSGAAVFTSAATYQTNCNIAGGLTTTQTLTISQSSGTSEVITVSNASGTGIASVAFYCHASGY